MRPDQARFSWPRARCSFSVMSLFGSIQLAGNTLNAMQIGLHVVGNNIANANTPGFIRERAIFLAVKGRKINFDALMDPLV